MALFNFGKTEKDPVDTQSPEFRAVAAGVAAEEIAKRIEALRSEGRSNDARQMVEQFFTRYAEIHKADSAPRDSLARVSYFVTYRLLPDMVFNRWGEFEKAWNGLFPFPSFIAISGASRQGVILSSEQVKEFKYYQGEFSDLADYYLVEFPTPPVNSDEPDLEQLVAIVTKADGASAGKLPVLGPYFAAVLKKKNDGEVLMYALGQSPGGGTTLRGVFANGSSNCGSGPDPTAMGFLEATANHMTRGGGEIAGVRFG